MNRLALITITYCVACHSACAEDWSGFRGSHGDGTTKQSEAPIEWSADRGVRWSVPLPSGGNGSPIVVGDKVFVTSAEDNEGKNRSLLCFDSDTGKPIWKRTVPFDREMPTHKTNPYGGSTPASDGKLVVVWHGSAGLHAYDMDGDPKWSRDLGEFRHMWGYGTSPIIVDDQVILHSGPGEKVFVAALDLQTGEDRWRHDEPVDGNGERNSDGQYMGSWSTPVLIERDKQKIAVCAFATRVCGIDIRDGSLVWECRGLIGERGDLAYSSPMIEGDLCVMMGGFKGPSFAFRIDGEGDLTETSRLWRQDKNNPQNIGTGLILGGYVYRLGAGPNLIDCLEAKSGRTVWKERAGDAAFWSSISYNGTNAYATDQQGTTHVFKPSTGGLRMVAKNELGDRCNATPALAGNRIYIRTYKKLWCIDGK